ncbi:MAG: hypothetical protein M1817_003767 [Caeruleum heppii]|nr:MAG: hypothetical protein M1817_003767 [Caeruleum heppii]
MAKGERSVNPAQAQHKADKQKALKKGKAEQLARRTEKFARRNPDRLQRQLDELKELEASGQPLHNRDKKVIEELERDIKAVRKAREALGDKAPQFGTGAGRGGRESGPRGGRGGFSDGRGGRGGGTLGKRRRDGGFGQDGDAESDSSTSSSVRNIPMPRDTPPPIPAEFLRRPQGNRHTNPNLEPLPTGPDGQRIPHALPTKPGSPSSQRPPPAAAQTVYEAKPIVRDLRKEAVSKFVPAAVRQKSDASRGTAGKLLEPEEADLLERQGYGGGAKDGGGEGRRGESTGAKGADELVSLEEEERRFAREVRGVEMEEVEDEDA